MTEKEKLALSVGIEFDFYINLAREGVKDKAVRTFISHIVIPRLMKMKAILGGYEETEWTWERRRKLEAEAMETIGINEESPVE